MRKVTRHFVSKRIVVAALVLGTIACGDDPVPTTPTDTSGQVEVFTGSLAPRGVGFYSFQTTSSANASFTLASLTSVATGRALGTSVQLGIGIPAGEGCSIANATSASPGLIAQLTHSVAPGTYCVQVSDIGNLTAPANFAVRIRRP